MDIERKCHQALAKIHKTVAAIASEYGRNDYASECQAKADANVRALLGGGAAVSAELTERK